MALMNSQGRWSSNPVIGGLCVTLALLVGIALWETINGHSENIAPLLINETGPGTMLILTLLTGFMWGASRHAGNAFRHDFTPVLPQLRGSPDERDTILHRYNPASGVGSGVAGGIGMLLGVLVIAEPGGNTPWLLSNQPWHHGFATGVAVNAYLFWLMGRAAYRSIRSGQLIAALGPMMPPVDLLDLSSYAPFARHGLRTAFLWLGGSSIASLIYVNQNRDLMTALVIVSTMSLGFYSLLQPLRGAHNTIARAKKQELARIRETIRACRGDLLDSQIDASSSAPGRIPGLLAYEARIAAVREWPLDVSTFVRFVLLLILAVGSWLGGAIVELLLGSVVGN